VNRLFPLPLSPCASAHRLFCWAFALPLRARLEEVVFCLCRALALSALSGGPVRRPLKVLPGKAVALGGGAPCVLQFGPSYPSRSTLWASSSSTASLARSTAFSLPASPLCAGRHWISIVMLGLAFRGVAMCFLAWGAYI